MRKLFDEWKEIILAVFAGLTAFATYKIFSMEMPSTVHAMVFQVLVGATCSTLCVVEGIKKMAEVKLAQVGK